MHKITIEIPSNGFCNKCPFLNEIPTEADDVFTCRRFQNSNEQETWGIWLKEHCYNEPKPLPCEQCENEAAMKSWQKRSKEGDPTVYHERK